MVNKVRQEIFAQTEKIPNYNLSGARVLLWPEKPNNFSVFIIRNNSRPTWSDLMETRHAKNAIT